MIEIQNLTKRFGKTTALDGLNVRFGENKIYGLLGRNGAGKTTLLNIITGRLFADQGSVTLDGEEVVENDAALSKIYLMSEKTLYPPQMKIREVFKWSKLFYPDFDTVFADDLSGQFHLDVRKPVKSLSTGYNSIFKLIVALSTNAPYLLLDEPVLGLDANHRDLFYRTLLARYADKPSTVVLSTHLVEEVSNVVEDVVIIDNGQVLRNESRETLLSSGYTVSGFARVVDVFLEGKNVIGAEALGRLKTAYVLGERPEQVPEGVEVSRLDLQKLFVRLTDEKREG
jgi:ABC-2 type transport system ATP-binding protein